MKDDSQALPEALSSLLPDKRVELDVRSILNDGGEPFSLIMQTAEDVPAGHVLSLRAPFKPLPLFGVMRAKGWRYWIEQGEGNDWIVLFYRTADFN